MEELATLRAPAERFERLIRETSVTSPDEPPVFRLVRLSLSADRVVATRPTAGEGPTFEVRYADSFLSAIDVADESVFAALGTEATVRWLDWFEGESLTARFFGDGDAGVAGSVELDDGSDSVAVGPLPSEVVDPDVDAGRPTAFDDDTFAPDGTPAPTTVETDAETLERVADAADIVDDEGFPVVVSDGEFRLAVVGDEMHARGSLPATVDGPDCENRYGSELATLARVLSGELTLRVVPGGPLAVVQESEDARRRYVLEQTM